MNIKTKYNIGDAVFFLAGNEIQKGVVQDLIISVRPDIYEKYSVKCVLPDCGENTIELFSDRPFATPNALVEGLLSDFSERTTK